MCWNMQKKIRRENGSVTVVMLASIFVILLVLGNLFTLSTNQRRLETEEMQKIREAYDMTPEELEQAYRLAIGEQVELVNAPEMLTGMKKIMFTEPTEDTKGQIVQEGEAGFDENNWYSYKDRKWANAQTEDGSMWVWIPRFAYRITKQPTYSNGTTKQAGTIEVKFLIGTSDEYYDDNGKIKKAQRQETKGQQIDTTKDEYTVHPAFTNEDYIDYANGGWNAELTGIWVAKFEAGYAGGNNNAPIAASSETYTQTQVTAGSIEGGASQSARNWLDGIYGENTTIKYPTFQGVTYSMNYINADDAYYISQALTEEGNIYGLTDSTNSHLMKNSEWGAVAYLSQSQYGLPEGNNIYINNVTLNSGGAARTTDKGQTGVESVYAVTGVTGVLENGTAREEEIANLNKTEGNTPTTEGFYTWNQKTGKESSCTGTIYGIYDLSGGLRERTATYVANGNANLETYGKNFTGDENTHRRTIYVHDEEKDNNKMAASDANLNLASEGNYDINANVYGDAVHETSKAGTGETSWYHDASNFVGLNRPFAVRGGFFGSGEAAGIFAFDRTDGGSDYNTGFRVVLVAR